MSFPSVRVTVYPQHFPLQRTPFGKRANCREFSFFAFYPVAFRAMPLSVFRWGAGIFPGMLRINAGRVDMRCGGIFGAYNMPCGARGKNNPLDSFRRIN